MQNFFNNKFKIKTNFFFILDIQNQQWRKVTIVRNQNKYTQKINYKFKNK